MARRSLVLTVILLLGLPARGEPPSTDTQAKKAALGRFKNEWLTPYLGTGLGARAREALVAGRPEEAAKLLRRYLGRRKAPARVQAELLLAYALLEARQYGPASGLFDGLVKRYPLLVDYHRFHGARCRYKLKQFARAERLAAQVAPASPLSRDAELVRADALRALGRHAEVVKIWRAFLGRYPGGKQAARAHFRIAQALEELAKEAKGEARDAILAEALGHYKTVTVKRPLWRRAAEAGQRLAALARQVKGGAEKAALDDWERYAQARAYYLKVRHEKAEPAFAALLKRKLSDKLRCKASYYLAQTVFRQRERARAAPLFAAAAQACRKANERDLTVKSLYNGAKGLMRAHKFDQAIARFAELEKAFAGHSYADDARLWAAEAAETKGDTKQAASLLQSLPDRYPRGDMRREALWRLARAAIVKRDWDEALRHLDRTIDQLGPARYYYAHGQALYWKARILDQKKKPKEAGEHYVRCIREYPLSYYALLSFNRLREGRAHTRLYRRIYGELIAPVGKNAGAWRFKPRALFLRPGFLRAVELARLGFGDEAAAELARLGLGIRRGVERDDLWLTAVLFDRAGLWDRSHQVPRSLDHGYRRSYPLEEDYRRWRIAYPQAYRPIVVASARRSGVPRELVWSVMREESGFSPTIESWANAVGLMQLLVRTAARAGSEHNMEVNRRRLHDPAVNIKLGATYLGFLRRTFGGNPALAIAGYNAGEGAAMRWVRKMGNVPLDELLERIPYDQTRRYTKRVLSSLFAYSVLYRAGQQRIPRLGQRVPRPQKASLGRKPPKGKKKKKGRGK